MKLQIEKMENFDQFLQSLKKPVNQYWQGRSLSSETGSQSFTGTKNIEEAFDVLRGGYTAPLEKLKASEKLATAQVQNIYRQQARLHVCGVLPHIPNAILNLPLSMIDYYKQPQKAKVVNIVYNITVAASTSTEEMIRAGIQLLQLCKNVEASGYKLNLYITELCHTDEDHVIGWMLKLKDSKQPFDILKLCFPLVHPSMLRRLSFAWLERSPLVYHDSFTCGYGKATNFVKPVEEITEALKKCKLLGEADFYTDVRHIQKQEEVSKWFKKLGIK